MLMLVGGGEMEQELKSQISQRQYHTWEATTSFGFRNIGRS
jgi:hypothetical protein